MALRDDSRWWEQAACLGTETELWFPEGRGQKVPTVYRELCHGCPVRVECLEDALLLEGVSPRPSGWRGGLSPEERLELRRAQLRAG